MTRKIFILVAAASMLSASAGAQTSVPNTFTANTPANAEEVNANFTALVDAVNGLDTRVAALEAGGGAGPLTSDDVAGTWMVYSLESENSARDDSGAGITGGYLIQSTLTLDAGGSFTLSDTDDGVRVITTVFKSPCDPASPPNGDCVGDVQLDYLIEGSTEGDSGLWSLSGQTISLTFDGEPETQDLTVSADGNMLVTSFVEDEALPDNGSTMRIRLLSLAVGVRMAPQAP